MSTRQEKERRRREREQAQADAASAAQRRSNLRFAGGVAVALVAAVVLVIAGTHSRSSAGQDGGPTLKPVPENAAAASPSAAAAPRPRSPKAKAALAELKAQGNQVISDDVSARLAKLHGVPVVVNMWASWCPNCRAEFGYFQSLSNAYDGKVAFLGLDSNDSRGDAESFLKEFPIPYPSIDDPGATQARSIGAGLGWPTTLFYDAKGKQRFVRQGGYTTQESLDADIRTYALG